MFGGPFADGVGGVGLGGVVFVDGLLGLTAVGGAGGGEDDAADAGVAHGFHEADGAADVDLIVFLRVEDGLGDGDAGGEVVDAIYLGEKGPEEGDVVDVALDELDGGGRRPLPPTAEIIKHNDLMSIADEALG